MPRKNPTEFPINVSKRYTEDERLAIAYEVLEYIRDRSAKGLGPDRQKWNGKYSPGYTKSLDFRIAGKSKGKINQTLSGDMLTELELVDHDDGKIVVGYSSSNDQQGKAEGNIIGSYGKSTGSRTLARDFIKLSKDEIKNILSKFPIDNDKKREKNVQARLNSKEFMEEFEVESDYIEEED
jgi:hypothetical protein